MAKNGTRLVRDVVNEVSSEQGGTENSSADADAGKQAPDRLSSPDIADPNPDEGYGSQLGYTMGEWQGRDTGESDDEANEE